MFELTKDQFQCVNVLLPQEEGYVEPKSVIELNNPGWVFADSRVDPNLALIWSKGNKGFYLLGRQIEGYAEELNSFIDAVVVLKLLSMNTEYFEVSSVPPITNIELQSVFKPRKLNKWTQSVYIYRKDDRVSDPVLHDGCLCDSKEIGKKYSVKNKEFIENKILNYWHSMDAFHSNAKGFCLLIDDIVVSMAFTGWIAGNTHEISIETADDYRCKGFAKICATALINYYLEQGYLPYWECEKDNIASVKLAENLGFSKLYDYSCFGFSILD